jgi:hypothetical protein
MGASNQKTYLAKVLLLIGDSTLDNIVWVGKYENCIKHKLESLNPDYRVINYAADGYTSIHVVGGGHPDISWSHRKSRDAYPTAAHNKFHPLD